MTIELIKCMTPYNLYTNPGNPLPTPTPWSRVMFVPPTRYRRSSIKLGYLLNNFSTGIRLFLVLDILVFIAG